MSTVPFPADPILQAYEHGTAVALLTGWSLRDLCLDADGRIRPILEVLRRRLLQRHRMVLVTYSMAEGLHWSRQGLDDGERQAVEGLLRWNGLEGPRQDHELVCVVRGIATLARGVEDSRRLAGDRPVRFCFLLEFAEHLAPASTAGAAVPTDQQLVIAELVYLLAHSLSLRNLRIPTKSTSDSAPFRPVVPGIFDYGPEPRDACICQLPECWLWCKGSWFCAWNPPST